MSFALGRDRDDYDLGTQHGHGDRNGSEIASLFDSRNVTVGPHFDRSSVSRAVQLALACYFFRVEMGDVRGRRVRSGRQVTAVRHLGEVSVNSEFEGVCSARVMASTEARYGISGLFLFVGRDGVRYGRVITADSQ